MCEAEDQESREITDEMPLSDLTVGEFKQLVRELLAEVAPAGRTSRVEPPIEPVSVRRKSLDEFMNDLGGKK